ncbi:MAG: hypothetical protein H7A35_14270 [Planctomycetales bacterium]|nr:hypothetical protein [bacterium]UNM08002.1 MAG: hypothetical protein H7A35_14270 [Planctomycetales bacterium]
MAGKLKKPPLPGKPEYSDQEILLMSPFELVARLGHVSNPAAWRIAADLLIRAMDEKPAAMERETIHYKLRKMCNRQYVPEIKLRFSNLPRTREGPGLRQLQSRLERLRRVRLADYIMMGPLEAQQMLLDRHPVLRLLPMVRRLRKASDIAAFLVENFELVSRTEYSMWDALAMPLTLVLTTLVIFAFIYQDSGSFWESLLGALFAQTVFAIVNRIRPKNQLEALSLFLSFTDEVMDELEWDESIIEADTAPGA